MEEEKKETRGRKKGSKPMPVAAFTKESTEFVGFYVSAYQAAKVLYDGKTEYSTRVSNCAKGLQKAVGEFTFIFVDLSKGLDFGTIEKLKNEILERKRFMEIKFSSQELTSMDNADYKTLLALKKKYF